MSFAKLDENFIESSLKRQGCLVVDVFASILSRCKADGIAKVSVPFLSSITWHEDGKPVSVEEMDNVIRTLESPDPHSRSTNDEGRRIRRVDGGFEVINYQKYRAYTVTDYQRDYMRKYRNHNKGKVLTPQPPAKITTQRPAKKNASNTKNSIVLDNGKTIPFSFYQKLCTHCGEKEQAARIIYRAKDKDNPEAWITEGLKKENAYALVACPNEDIAPQKIRAWIDSKIYRITPEKVGDVLKGMEEL